KAEIYRLLASPLAQGAAIIKISSHLQSPTSPPTCRASLGQATFIARHAHSHATLEIRLMEAIDA
ncbi:MAG TPA: sugar ABC transporter ATP-binding protein, partial [Roseiarcus sp.]|nr:sugar ABC transporter ATP-binding protein [Roseiarcus sp.]